MAIIGQFWLKIASQITKMDTFLLKIGQSWLNIESQMTIIVI